MKAIEIYNNIEEAIGEEITQDTLTALDFISQNVRAKFYAKNTVSKIDSMQGALTAGNYIDPEIRAAAVIRQVISEEMTKHLKSPEAA